MNTFPSTRYSLTVTLAAAGLASATLGQVGWAQVSSSRQAALPGPGAAPPAAPVTVDRTIVAPAAPAAATIVPGTVVPSTVVPATVAPGTVAPAAVAPVAAAPAAVAPAAVAPVAVGTDVAVTGQVIRTKQVDLRGTTEKNLIALVDIGNGQRQIVELGTAANYKLAPVVTGDQIAARGPLVRIGQIDVVLASTAAIRGKEVLIQRDTPTTAVAVQAKAGYPVTEQVVKIDGRVNRMRTVRLEGSQQEHLIAEIVGRGGQAIITDLGPPEQIWRADVKQGEWITVRGQEMKIDNRPVFLALEINKNGVPTLIDRHLVRGEPAEVVQPAAIAETAAVVRPAVVTPPTTLVPGTTVERTTPAAVVPARVTPAVVVPAVPAVPAVPVRAVPAVPVPAVPVPVVP